MVELIEAGEVREALGWTAMIDVLERAFAAARVVAPLRHHHDMSADGVTELSTLLLMPAWDDAHVGMKLVSICPSNRERGLPTITGSYLLMDAHDGRQLAVIDGGELTARRTAAASLLAAKYLAPPNPSRLVVVGAGRVAENLAEAYASVFDLGEIAIWNRDDARAAELAGRLRDGGLPARHSPQLEEACRLADIVTCATASVEPLVNGDWLRTGTHLDLVGGFTAQMRECDDDAVRNAAIFVDTREGALQEGGDIVDPLRRGVITDDDILGDLFDLCSGSVKGRVDPAARTVFKSVGHALEDLAVAGAIYNARS